jgi:hypothetical protein
MANIAISDVCPQASSFFTCSTGPAARSLRTLSGVGGEFPIVPQSLKEAAVL